MRFTAIFWPSDAEATASPAGPIAYGRMLRIRLETPNHVHLILTPTTGDGLSRAVGEAHRRFTGFVNARAREAKYVFQGRFGCVATDEAHCPNAVRHLAFNPAPARLSLWNLSSCAALHPSQREWAIKTGTKMGQAGDDDAGDASHRGLAWHAATKREIITLRQQDSIRRPLLLAVPVPPSKPHGSPPQSA
jgi:hypothetical protein